MRVVRTIALAITAVVAVAALFQLPASPFARHGYPERDAVVPVSVATTEPADSPAVSLVPRRVVAPPVPIAYPVAGPQRYAVLPGDPAVIGRAGKLMRFQVAIESGITGVDHAGFARFVRDTYGAADG